MLYSVWIRKSKQKLICVEKYREKRGKAPKWGSEWCRNQKDLKRTKVLALTLVPLRQHFEITTIWLLIYIQRYSLCIKEEVWAMCELLIFELWPQKHHCWQSHYHPGGDTGAKSIIHGARARSQLISVQSRRSRLKPIRHLPEQHLPEEDGSTFAVSQSFTVRRQQRCCEVETNKSGIGPCFMFI